MINTERLVPEVYYNRSRDFQLMGRIYDIVFNYIKMNSDNIGNNPLSENSDDKLISLVATTLGFKEVHEYNTKQLRALCSVFSQVLRCKGTLQSVQTLLNLLINVENIRDEYFAEIDIDNPYLLNIYLPLSITDTSLFEDTLYYVLPAGMSYRIIRELLVRYPINDVLYIESDYIKDNNTIKAAVQAKMARSGVISQLHKPEEDETNLDNSAELGLSRIEDMSIVDTEIITGDYVEEIEEKVITPLPKKRGRKKKGE